MPWPSGLLVAAGFGYALYVIGTLLRLRYTTVHHDFWIIYDRLFEVPFPVNVLTPENGHSMILPGLIWLANMLVFRGDETPLFALALASLVSIAALLIDIVLRDRRRGPAESSLLIVTALAATFWLAKLQILLSAGDIITGTFPILGLLLGVRGLTPIDATGSGRAIRWWAVWTGAVISTFSFGTGVAAWPALGLIAWARRAPWRHLGAWCVGMLVCLLLIMGVLPRWTPSDTALQNIVLAPLENLKHWLELLGSPVANTWAGMAHAEAIDPMLGFGSGIAGAGLAAWGLARAWKRRRDLSQAEWTGAALVLFAALAAALISVGRTALFSYYFPLDQFFSRYLWWTAYFWMGLIWLLASSGRMRPALRARLHLIAAVLCLAGVWPAHLGVRRQFEYQRAAAEAFVASLVSGVPWARLYPPLIDPRPVFRLNATLREKKLCYYARDGYCSIGEPLDKWFAPGSETEPARLKPSHFYASVLDKNLGVRIAGWLERGPADLILVTDQNRVVRGLGGCFGELRPSPVADEGSFVAFAPVTELGEGFQIWTVRGRESRRVIPRLVVPKPDRLDKPED